MYGSVCQLAGHLAALPCSRGIRFPGKSAVFMSNLRTFGDLLLLLIAESGAATSENGARYSGEKSSRNLRSMLTRHMLRL